MNANGRPVEPSWDDRRFSRRGFLAGAAALSAGAMVGRQAGVAHAAEGGSGLHGAELRGMYLTSKDRLAEAGSFEQGFAGNARALPAWWLLHGWSAGRHP